MRRALEGQGEPASQIVPSLIVGYNPELHLTQPDRAHARALLAQAGYASGFEIRLDGTNNRYVNDTQILAEVARQLAEVGVRVRVNALEKSAFFALSASGQSSFQLFGWSCEAGDAGDALDSLGHSRQANGLGDGNDVGLADPELDRLIVAANAARQSRERMLLLQRAMARLGALRAYLPLHVQTESVLLSRRVDWDPPFLVNLVPAEMRRAASR